MTNFNKSFITSKFLGGPTVVKVAPGAMPGIEEQKKSKKAPRSSKPKLGLKFTANRDGEHTVVFNDPTNKRSIIRSERGDFYMMADSSMKHAMDTGSLAGSSKMNTRQANHLMDNIVGGNRYIPGEKKVASLNIQKLSDSLPPTEPDINPEPASEPAPVTTPEFKKGGAMTYKKGSKAAKPMAAVKYNYGMSLPKGKNTLKPRKKKCGGKTATHVVMKKGGDTGDCGCGGGTK